MVKFFADYDGEILMPYTTNLDAIEYNIYNIDRYCGTSLMKKFQKDGVLAEILPVFQFVCIISLSENFGNMCFMRGDTPKAEVMAFYEKGYYIDESEKFLHAYFYVNKNYESLAGGAELISLDEWDDL